MTSGRDPVAASLAQALQGRVAGRIAVIPTNNRVRLVSFRKRRGGVEVRVARRLMALGDQVIAPIVGFVCDDPTSRGQLRRLYGLLPETPGRRRQRPTMTPRGEVYDLTAIRDHESIRALGAPSDVDITWGPRRRKWRPQRSIRLGAYYFDQSYIRIHRRLDDPAVPDWFVGFVVFHELLHHRIGAGQRGGRRILHPPEFRAAEAQHPRFHDAQAWEAKELPRLLRRRPPWAGRP